jgi:hypothetical protein
MKEAALRFISSEENMNRVIEVGGWMAFLSGIAGAVVGFSALGVLAWPHIVAYVTR